MDGIVFERLSSMGFELSEDDISAIEYIEKKKDEYLRNVYGIGKNDDIAYARADFICSEFIMQKKSQLSSETERQIIKSITEGDVSISYEDSSLESVVEGLAEESERVFEKYRKIIW